jgi:Na+-translocating ferredoxin:NAD+ oxidoreductase subunit E
MYLKHNRHTGNNFIKPNEQATVFYKSIITQGLWKNNPALVQLLGLCPLLAVSNNVVNALGMGIATLWVLTGSNIAISCIARFVPTAVRLPCFVMVIAAFTTSAELLLQAFSYPLYAILGIFIPLIVTNCVILARAESFASKASLRAAAVDGLAMGAGFTLVIVLLGGLRELLGTGALFSDMHLLFCDAARQLYTPILGQQYPGFILALLPPGAFLVMGLLMAGKNFLDSHIAKRQIQVIKIPDGSKRVRSTGIIQ